MKENVHEKAFGFMCIFLLVWARIIRKIFEREDDLMVDLKEITITEVSTMLENKKISVKELTQEYIQRIKILDQGENGLNSVLELNPDAMEIAGSLDEQHTYRKSLTIRIVKRH